MQRCRKETKQPAFLTKHLNIWVNADHAWMDMRKWEQCADEKLNEDDFEGAPCIIGLDLASKLDILASIKVFWRDIGDVATKLVKRHYYVFGIYWVPEARVELTAHSQYQGWVRDNKLQTCPGETNDYDLVETWVREQAKRFQVVKVAHDPYQAVEIVNHLQNDLGIDKLVEVAQNTKQLSKPMKELEAAVYDGRLHFNGDPVLTWAVSNVVCHRDKNDNLFPNKERFESKIDPATALLTALNQLIAQPVEIPKFEIFAL